MPQAPTLFSSLTTSFGHYNYPKPICFACDPSMLRYLLGIFFHDGEHAFAHVQRQQIKRILKEWDQHKVGAGHRQILCMAKGRRKRRNKRMHSGMQRGSGRDASDETAWYFLISPSHTPRKPRQRFPPALLWGHTLFEALKADTQDFKAFLISRW